MFHIGIFLSAFLLFSIQPMITKYFLPWFGGSASVWATSLVFFTVVLLFGYLYAHLIASKLSPKKQVIVHATLLFLSFCLLVFGWTQWGAPLNPPTSWKTTSDLAPALHLLTLLLVTVGLPYLILSASSPLLQAWLIPITQRTPYRLYRLSNIGSIGALLAYPFFIEPFLSLQTQSRIWSVLFLVCAVVLVWCGIKMLQTDRAQKVTFALIHDRKTILRWLLLALLPAALLVSTTTMLTQGVASVPFLWILPLTLYLLSFVIAFSERQIPQKILLPLVFFFGIFSLFFLRNIGLRTLPLQLMSYLSFFFFSATFFHSLLYKRRPDEKYLTHYYVIISLGGALGTSLVSLGAPWIFHQLTEFPLLIILTTGLSVFFFLQIYLGSYFSPRELPLSRLVVVVLFFAILLPIFVMRNSEVFMERNFYGVLEVRDREKPFGKIRLLMNGEIVHGAQFLDEKKSLIPTTYYAHQTGIGFLLSQRGKARKVAAFGLGSGAIAAYCTPEDSYRFFEIDPEVEQVARTYFSYLSQCKNTDVVVGDARLSFEQEYRQDKWMQYDVIVLDAFTDDSVPVHLLTKEAFDLYLSRLQTDGVIAVNISNRYLDFTNLMAGIARVEGLNARLIQTESDPETAAYGATWVLLSRSTLHLPEMTDERWIDLSTVDSTVVWTDMRSNLFSVIRGL